jgi:hypothetical protein
MRPEDQRPLAHKQRVEAERMAQAILRAKVSQRNPVVAAMERVANAPRRKAVTHG